MIQLSAFSDEADNSLSGQIAALQRNGIVWTEFRSADGKNVSEYSEKEANVIRRRLNDEGIRVWAVGSPLGKCGIDITEENWLERVKSICGIAGALGTDKVRAFSFFHAYGERNRVFDYLNQAAEVAESVGVVLYHENEKNIYGDICERVAELMRVLPKWKFIYDPANFLQVGEKPENSLKLAPKCEYYHIKDAIAQTGEITPAGEGDGKIEELLGTIDKDAVLTVEPHLALFGAYAQIDGSELKLKHRFESNRQAFDTAVTALKRLLEMSGWQYANGGYKKNGIRS